MTTDEFKKMAKKRGWEFLTIQENIGMISFVKADIRHKKEMRINIYMTKMTVGTCLDHPKKGKTQMFRKKVSNKEMDKIFKNPRHHTNRGYQTK